MLAVTVLDNVSGLKAKHFRNTKHASQGIELPESAYLLDDSFIILQKNWGTLVLLSRRRIKKADGNDAVLTWIGIYVASPRQYDKRDGLYCGAGVWLLDTVASGEALLSFLGKELERLYSSMGEKRIPSEWRVEDVELSVGRLEFDEVISSEKPLSAARGISADRNMGTCFLGRASSATLATSIAKAQEGMGFRRFSKIFITDDFQIVDDLRRRGRATECDKVAGGNASSIQDDGITINQELVDIDAVRSLRKEMKMIRGIIDDTAGKSERQLREVKKWVVILLIISCGIVLETTSAFIPTILGGPAVHGIVKPLDHASPSAELPSTQTHPAVLAEPGVQPDGSRATGCLDAPTEGAVVLKSQPSAPENSSIDGPPSPNSKVSECLAKSFEELSNLIEKVVPTIQKNAALKKALGEARESARKVLEAVNPK